MDSLRICAKSGYHLYRIRPTLPMFAYLVWLARTYVSGLAANHELTLGRESPSCSQLRLGLRSVLLDFPSASHFLNITAFMTWADEDFVGRISRAEWAEVPPLKPQRKERWLSVRPCMLPSNLCTMRMDIGSEGAAEKG